jgi:mRNA interferase RelE/StbE
MARMAFEIILAPEAVDDLAALRATDRTLVKSEIEVHLRHEPAKESKSRIKRLRGTKSPEYRLRIGQFRVFYDISESAVHVLAVVEKPEAENWLRFHAVTL